MRIDSIRIRNFYSIQDVTVDFQKYNKSVVFIEGKNKDNGGGSNGSGKSTIFEAVVWGLFGRTIRKSTEETLVNNLIKKDCEVTITIDGNVEVRRTKRPTFLSFNVNGLNKTKESVVATQEAIEQYFNINYKTFLTSVHFGQQNEVDFISASADDKRTIIKNFLALEDLFSVREKIKEMKSSVSAELKAKDSVYNEYTKTNEKNKKSLDELKKEKKSLLEKYKLDRIYTLQEILDIEKKINSLLNSIDDAKEIITENKKEQQRLTVLINQPDNICYACKTNLGKTSKQSIDKWVIDIAKLDKDIKDQLVNIDSAEKELKTVNLPISSSEYVKIENIHLSDEKIKVYESLIEKYTGEISSIYEDKKVLSKKLEILKFWENICSEHGVIKYVISSIIDYFNNKCVHYLSYITNGKFIIKFDDTLTEIITIDGIVTNYHSLSGGEKKKINLAVMLSLQSLFDLTSKGKCNLLMMDEVVESLDEESIPGICNLLQELSKSKLVLVISHNVALKDALVEKQKIALVRKNKVTRLA
jgi:DNA repair exonuclease SbcCD ATPase subunit